MPRRTIRRRKQKTPTQNASSSVPNNIAVNELYLSHLSNVDHEDIRISSVEEGSKTENKIPLKLDHSGNFGLLQLSYKGKKFHDYFPPDATIKMSEILLKKSTTKNNEFSLKNIKDDLHNGSWEIIHIITEKKSDCNYLFEKAIEDNYTVILAIQFEIFNGNNASRRLTLHPHGVNGTPLHRAVAEKDIKVIEALLRCNLNINARNKDGWTPLLVAVDLEMPEVVDFLINKGADVNAQNKKLQVPLHYAAKRNNLKILDNLIKNRAKLNEKDKYCQSSLHYAVDAGSMNAVDILLKKGADYRYTDSLGHTSFHLAAKRLIIDIIEVFLNNHTDANILNSDGQTPLFSLSMKLIHSQPKGVDKETYSKVINAFVQKGANVNFQDSEGKTRLHYAVVYDDIELVQALLECQADVNIPNKSGKNVLHVASGWHRANKCIQVLLDFKIDINAVDVEEKTALHVAVKANNYDAIKLILNKNPNIDMIDRYGKTALHLAIESKCLSIIELLLENNADVNLKDESGKTALHLASASPNITINIVKSILNSTNDINAKDNLGRAAIHYAALNHNVNTLRYLLAENADINANDSKGKTPLHVTINPRNNYFECVKVLLDHKADINAVDNDLISPLHLACLIKNARAVEYLIEHEADSSMRDKDGKTVFHYTCMKDNGEKEHFREILNILVEENISINCVDIFGKTPLHYAAKYYSLSVINELLLNVGADINIEDKNHNLPLDKSIELFFFSTHTRPYIEHIVKMKVMKLWVRERFLDQIYKEDDEHFLKRIQNYEDVCNKEIDLMKSTNLDQSNTTYYDFLKKSPHDAVNYTRNQYVVSAIKLDGLITMFPIYGHFLKNRLREAQRRNNLYEKIQVSLDSYIFEMLPTPCMNEILRYLNNSELNILLKAMRPVASLK